MKTVMRRFLRSFTYGEKGFTLIELLVVVAILGILAAVAVPNLIKFMGAGDIAAAQAEAASVTTAADAYFADGGDAATTGAALATAGYLRGTPKGTYDITSLTTGGVITGTGYWITAKEFVWGTPLANTWNPP